MDVSKEVAPFVVEFFEEENGRYPAEEFMLSQDLKMRAKLFRMVELLENKGNELREPYSKHLGDGIFDLRVKQGTNISRVLYFFVVGRRIVLTNGFVKKTQKTPVGEIEVAKKSRSIYQNREGDL